MNSKRHKSSWISKIIRRKEMDTMARPKPGDKVFITTLVHVYEGTVVQEDTSNTVLRSGPKFFVKVDGTGELVSVDQYLLTVRGVGDEL